MTSANLLLIALTLSQTPEPAGKTWTLAELVKLADEAHPDVREADIRAGQARADLVTAGLLPNPQLQTSLSNVPTWTLAPGVAWSDVLVYGLGVSEEVELGGKRGKRQASAGTAIEAADATARDVRRTSRTDVQSAFFKALAAQNHQRLAEEAMGHYKETIRLSRARASAGDLAGADLNKIELEMLRYESEVRSQAQAAAQARGDLFRLLALPADARADRVEGPFRSSPATPSAQTIDQALERRPDVQALEAQHRKAEADLELARAQAVPDLTLGLGYSYSPTDVPSGAKSSIGLSASLPLPIFNRNQGEVQKAELEVERTQHALERAKTDARRDVQLALNRLSLAEAALAALESEYLAKATQARDLAEKTYLEGHTSLLEELEAQRTYLDTRSAHVDAQLERSLGAVELERALGSALP